jgi:hypothetical protein
MNSEICTNHVTHVPIVAFNTFLDEIEQNNDETHIIDNQPKCCITERLVTQPKLQSDHSSELFSINSRVSGLYVKKGDLTMTGNTLKIEDTSTQSSIFHNPDMPISKICPYVYPNGDKSPIDTPSDQSIASVRCRASQVNYIAVPIPNAEGAPSSSTHFNMRQSMQRTLLGYSKTGLKQHISCKKTQERLKKTFSCMSVR